MNDEELMTLVREQRGKIPMTTPVDQIVTRGRAVRARRRIPGLTAAMAVAAAAAVSVALLLPGGHPATHQQVQLAAWTVVKQSDGSIDVTIRQFSHPAALQERLRDDGVPVRIETDGVSGCHGYPGPVNNVDKIVHVRGLLHGTFLVIHPAAIPPEAGLLMSAVAGRQGTVGFGLSVVSASPQCTGIS